MGDRLGEVAELGHGAGERVGGGVPELDEERVDLGGGAETAVHAADAVQAVLDEAQQRLRVALVEQQQRDEVLAQDHRDRLSIMVSDPR